MLVIHTHTYDDGHWIDNQFFVLIISLIDVPNQGVNLRYIVRILSLIRCIVIDVSYLTYKSSWILMMENWFHLAFSFNTSWTLAEIVPPHNIQFIPGIIYQFCNILRGNPTHDFSSHCVEHCNMISCVVTFSFELPRELLLFYFSHYLFIQDSV